MNFMDFQLFVMSLLHETKLICKRYNIIPNRERGQNFLIDKEIYDRIVEIANLSKTDIAFEVGAGLGVLTKLLCEKAGKVFAVEIDKKIFDYLTVIKEREKLDNLELLNRNILDFKIAEFIKLFAQGRFSDVFESAKREPLSTKLKIVANLPYNITSIFLRKFLFFLAEQKIDEMVLMVQKEVAERIVSKPGKMSLLSVSVQFYGNAQILAYADKSHFWPQPKVDSAIIKLTPISDLADKKLRLETDEKIFFQIARIGFSAKRKKLMNNLANGLRISQYEILRLLQEIGLNSNVRAQELSVIQWINLANLIFFELRND